MRARALSILVALTTGMALPTHAANLGWLKGTIIERYDDRDRSILGSELLNALDFQPDGVAITWWNARSGHWGVITPLDRSARDGVECRRVRIQNHLDERKGLVHYTVCRRPGEDWMLASID